jgi:hypothetical protein
MSAYSNIKTIIKSSVIGEEKMTHHPVRSEITYPASGRVEKLKVHNIK